MSHADLQQSLDDHGLATLVSKQVNSLFPDGSPVQIDQIMAIMPTAMERIAHCFSRINNKYFFDGTRVIFDHLHGDQYAMFLYLLANTAYRQGAAATLPAKLYRLNKALHGIDAYFEVELPSVFLFIHPLGTVLGRANYSDYLLVYQRCGVGSNHDVYPSLGEYVTLHPGSSVLGTCTIGDRCAIAAESLVLDRDLPADTLYIGNPRDCLLKAGSGQYPVWRVPNE